MPDRLKLALVGCGAISKMHVMGIRAGAPRTEVAAVVDVDRERAQALARETGGAVYGSLDEALAKGGFDAVDLMLPHQLHESAALAAFARGKHVLLEKPMATTPDACARILAAARKAGTVFMVGENAQYWPEVVRAHELIARGAIGEVVTARACIFFPPLAAYYGGERAWRLRRDAAGGGVAIDTGSHWLRPLHLWLGELEEVVAALGRPFVRMEGESLVRALLRFRSGRIASFDALLSEAPLAPELLFRITGSAGEIAIDGLGRTLLYDAEHRKGVPVGEPGGYLQSYAGEMADFEAAVLDGRPLAAGPEASLGELRAALAMVRSAETGRWEKVWT
ncbi:MAG TPA: Gfo/Idh/MocA family oxidoreductase [Myxococcota bacterium]